MPILAIAVSDDEMAPHEAMLALLEHYPKAQIDRRVVDTLHMGYGSVGHMGFFRSKMRDPLWFPVLNWILKHRGRDQG
jgi:predicted alpha/beta hydrolase